MKTFRRTLSFILLFALCISTFPFSAQAIEPVANSLFVDGQLIPSGRQRFNDVDYVSLGDYVSAIGSTLSYNASDNSFTFPWRKSEVSILSGASSLTYYNTEYTLIAASIPSGQDLLVPVESFSVAIDISYYYDAEYDTVYCTPGAGHWPIPENYACPILMYHGIGYASPEANLFVDSEVLEEQIVWLLENDFTPIWFEDLWHVEDFSKPVILVFDDGWLGVYKHLYPLTEKYHVKAVAAVVRDIAESRNGKHCDPEMIVEMAEHNLIAFESHGVTHESVPVVPLENQEMELRDSELWLTRLVKREPVAFVYPIGGSTPYVQDLVRQYYTFGAKMVGALGVPYNTSDDPTLAYRYFIERQTGMFFFSLWMNNAFNNIALNNYSPPKA